MGLTGVPVSYTWQKRPHIVGRYEIKNDDIKIQVNELGHGECEVYFTQQWQQQHRYQSKWRRTPRRRRYLFSTSQTNKRFAVLWGLRRPPEPN